MAHRRRQHGACPPFVLKAHRSLRILEDVGAPRIACGELLEDDRRALAATEQDRVVFGVAFVLIDTAEAEEDIAAARQRQLALKETLHSIVGPVWPRSVAAPAFDEGRRRYPLIPGAGHDIAKRVPAIPAFDEQGQLATRLFQQGRVLSEIVE